MKSLLVASLVLCMLAISPLAGQKRGGGRSKRPKTIAAAVAGFDKVRDQDERNRFGAIRDLGRFAEAQSTKILLAELDRSQTISYRQTVVRALGYKMRRGCVGPLTNVLRDASNPRMADAAAEAMRRQGEAGIDALSNELARTKKKGAQRNAICYALGRVETGAAVRDALLAAIQRAGGNDRLPPLRGLAARQGDDLVDELRVQLAGDKSTLVASTALEQLAKHAHSKAPRLAVDLLRRLPATAGADLFAAAMAGMLVAPAAEHHADLMLAASQAEDAFGKDYREAWQRALHNPALQTHLGNATKSTKNVAVAIASARALAWSPAEQQPAARASLLTMLRSGQPELTRAAATSLIIVAPDNVSKAALAEVLDKGKPENAAIACGALHALQRDDEAWHGQLLLLSKNKRPKLRAVALRCLCTAGAEQQACVEAASNNLSYRDWTVRAAAIELLVATRSPKSPPLLFARMDKEKARMREDVRAALLELTGLQFRTLGEWQKWWQKEGANFRPRNAKDGRPGRNADDATASYWNIPVVSDRVTFVVDVSGSMSQPFGTGDGTRLDEAKRQLTRVFDSVPKKAKINVVTFEAKTDTLFKKLQKLGKRQLKQAASFVADLRAKGPTNVHDALRVAFADADIDTIFLLTDGRPSVGPIVSPTELADEVQRWNLGRGIRIHTIAIGEKSAFLQRLAKDSGGEHSVAR